MKKLIFTMLLVGLLSSCNNDLDEFETINIEQTNSSSTTNSLFKSIDDLKNYELDGKPITDKKVINKEIEKAFAVNYDFDRNIISIYSSNIKLQNAMPDLKSKIASIRLHSKEDIESFDGFRINEFEEIVNVPKQVANPINQRLSNSEIDKLGKLTLNHDDVTFSYHVAHKFNRSRGHSSLFKLISNNNIPSNSVSTNLVHHNGTIGRGSLNFGSVLNNCLNLGTSYWDYRLNVINDRDKTSYLIFFQAKDYGGKMKIITLGKDQSLRITDKSTITPNLTSFPPKSYARF
ncbi:hypothetical protein [Aquimarina brevivitae]|uniref:Uncharacterized protein n=1 Tax=Aquimarina brevivitae TaxID=323412 RepID=A0A4Q7P0W5_9FLAO|nr:hypothetical protein [Aquimarina brevivitae]RZS93335.1 hypothetical protein EV197_1913 [Aquimarina brevivitae]